jgi:poly-gamma-glutamate capsule biosynthesis protein CapA/YwtB (metallophosphatase superfamily)
LTTERKSRWLLLATVVGALAVDCRGRRRPEPAPPDSASALPSSIAGVPSAEPLDAGALDAEAAEDLVVLLGGDVNLGRTIGRSILRGKEPEPFAGLDAVLRTSDLVFVNLESQLSDQHGETQSSWSPLVFTGPPGGADLLARAGIHAVSVANNHIWDYGKQAFFETLTHLERAGVAYVGASREPDQMFEPVVIRKKGFSVALFAVTQIWNQGEFRGHSGEHQVAWADRDRLDGRLRAARRDHDVVLLGYHGGGEYVETPLPSLQGFAEQMMQTGLDALAGHHPHVPQGIGWHEGRPIFYSLGNLVFRMHKDFAWTGMSFLARLTFRRDRSVRVEACPYRIRGDNPELFGGPSRETEERMIRRHLALLSYGLGGIKVGEPGEHSCMSLSPPAK